MRYPCEICGLAILAVDSEAVAQTPQLEMPHLVRTSLSKGNGRRTDQSDSEADFKPNSQQTRKAVEPRREQTRARDPDHNKGIEVSRLSRASIIAGTTLDGVTFCFLLERVGRTDVLVTFGLVHPPRRTSARYA